MELWWAFWRFPGIYFFQDKYGEVVMEADSFPLKVIEAGRSKGTTLQFQAVNAQHKSALTILSVE